MRAIPVRDLLLICTGLVAAVILSAAALAAWQLAALPGIRAEAARTLSGSARFTEIALHGVVDRVEQSLVAVRSRIESDAREKRTLAWAGGATQFAIPSLLSNPHLYAIHVANASGHSMRVQRRPEGGFETRDIDPHRHAGIAIQRRFDAGGRLLEETREASGYDVRRRDWTAVIASGGAGTDMRWTAPSVVEDGSRQGLVVATRVIAGDAQPWALAFELPLDTFDGITSTQRVGESGAIALVTYAGDIAGLPGFGGNRPPRMPANEPAARPGTSPGTLLDAALRTVSADGVRREAEIVHGGRRWYVQATGVRLGDLPFQLVAYAPRAEFSAWFDTTTDRFYYLAAFLVGFSYLLARATAHFVAAPIRQLAAQAGALGSGDPLAFNVPRHAPREFGQLAESLRHAATLLRSRNDRIEALNRDLESQVAQRTAELQALFDTLPHPVVVFAGDTTIANCNRAVERAFGRPREALICRRLGELDVFSERRRAAQQRAIEAVIASGEHSSEAFWLKYADGVDRFVRFIGTPFPRSGDEPAGMIGVLMDITDLKRSGEVLAQSEARFRDFAEASGDWYFEVDAGGRYAWISGDVERVTGLAPGDYLGRPVREFIAADQDLSREPWRSHFEAIGRRERFRDFRHIRRFPNGRQCWISTSGTPVHGADGAFAGYRCVASDITDRLATEERLKAAIDQLDETFILCDADDRIVYVNSAYRRVHPAAGDLLQPGRRFEEHLRVSAGLGRYPEAVGDVDGWIARRLDARRHPRGPREVPQSDGTWRRVLDERLPDGAMLTVAFDITERKRAEQALKQSEERFRSFAELSSDWYWEQDTDYRFTLVAGKFPPGAEFRESAFIGRQRWELPAGNMEASDWARHRAALERREAFRDLRIRGSTEGDTNWISVTGAPLYDDAGRFTGYRGIAKDVTREVQHETALREARERLDRALDYSNVSHWEVDFATDTVYLSHGWAQFLGIAEGPVTASIASLAALVHPEDLPRARELYTKVRADPDEEYAVEYRIRAANGDWRWAFSRGRATARDAATGLTTRMSGTNLDITERMRVEFALRESERKLKTLLENFPGCVYRSGPGEGRPLEFVSQGALALTERDDLVASAVRFDDLMHPDDAPAAADMLRSAIGHGMPYAVEYRIRSASGKEKWVLDQGTGVRRADGTLVAIEGYAVDVTELKRTQQALANSEQRFRDFARASGDWFWEASPEGRIVWVSEGLDTGRGRPPQPVTGRTVRELAGERVAGGDSAAIDAHMARVRQREPFRDFRYQRQGANGRVWISSSGVPVYAEDGTFRGYRGTASDVTRDVETEMRARAVEREMHESYVLLRAITDNSPLAIVLSTTQDEPRLTFANPAARRMYAIPDDLAALDPRRLWADPRGRDRLIEQLRGGGRVIQEARDIRTFDGRAVRVEFSAELITVGVGEALLSITADLSDRQRMEAALSAAKEEAEAASQAKSQFLANMSHEIRTPMNAIVGMAHLALRSDLPPRQRGYVARIDRAAQSLLRILSDILDLSKVEAGKFSIEDIAFDLDAVLADAMDLAGVGAHGKGIEILLDVAAGLPRALVGDPIRIGQVLNNLLSNAVKFTERGTITLAVRGSAPAGGERELIFEVRDTGVGLSAEAQARLFAPFSQADASTTRRYGGTGLGLFISRRLVELMSGRLTLESTAGVGSVVRFTIPLRVADACEAQGSTGDEGLRGKRALVVDDHESFRTLIRRYLEELGMTVHAAECAEEGLPAATMAAERGLGFDVVLLDMRLPGMSGIDAAKELRSALPGAACPRLLLVTSGEIAGLEQAPGIDALDGVLRKPITRPALRDALAALAAPAAPTDGAPRPAGAVTKGTHALDLRGMRLLVVEDDEINQEVALGVLEPTGAEVRLAANGREALDLLARTAFDLVLMDLQMPVMDGITAARAIRAEPAHATLPIIAMTASAMAGDRERLLAAGMNDYVAKPVRVASLYATLDRWIGTGRREAPPDSVP